MGNNKALVKSLPKKFVLLSRRHGKVPIATEKCRLDAEMCQMATLIISKGETFSSGQGYCYTEGSCRRAVEFALEE